MFVDVCFPNNNEKTFIEIAKKLNTRAICFVYEKLPKEKIQDKEIKIYYGSVLEDKNAYIFLSEIPRNISKNPKQHYYCGPFIENPYFHAPVTSINQVIAKELKNKEKLVGISFNSLLKTKQLEKTRFIVELFEKYNVDLFIASFATSPYELRNMLELKAFSGLLKMNTKAIKNSLNSLSHFFNKSATFL